MSPRKPTPPPYKPNHNYPGRDAENPIDLTYYFEKAAKTTMLIVSILRINLKPGDPEDAQLLDALSAVADAREQLEQAQRLLAEYAMRDQKLSQLRVAEKLRVSQTSTYRWRLDPLAEEDLS